MAALRGAAGDQLRRAVFDRARAQAGRRRRSCQLCCRPLCRPCRDEFGRRLRLRPDRLHAARRLPLLRPADARVVRPHGEPRRSGRPRDHRASPQAGRRRRLERAARSRRDIRARAGCGGDPSSAGQSSRPIASWPSATATSASTTIAARLDWSRKHLSQRFQDEIGLSPKSLARMMRFNRALDLANRAVRTRLGRPRRRMRLCRPGASDARIRRVRRRHARPLPGARRVSGGNIPSRP